MIWRLSFLLSLSLLTTCASSDEPEQPKQQDLGYRYTVVCRNEMQDCFDRCQELCPKGYLVMNRVRGRKVGEDTEYSLIIRCKDKR